MAIKKEDVKKALEELEDVLTPVEASEEGVDKSSQSEPYLDNPEGDDLDAGHMKNKMSDAAGGSGKAKKKGHEKMKDAKKSLMDDLPEEVETKVEVSDFLKSLVNHLADSTDNLREAVVKSGEASEEKYGELAERVDNVQQSQAKLGVVLKALCEKVGVISAEPARAPKAETTISKSGVVERNFENPQSEEGDQKPRLFKSLSENPQIAKTQITDALCDLVKSGSATDTDVIGFESGGYIKPELVSLLKEKLN